jgi:4-hydroxybenzoate polyprenyltransferase
MLLAYLKEQKKKGRVIALATASHQKYALQIAEHLGIFERVFATNGLVNIASTQKANALVKAYGQGQFVYAGNARPDMKVWLTAAAAIVVGPSKSLFKEAEKLLEIEHHFPLPKPGIKAYLKACRIHQWVKNVLVFVPMFAAHQVTELNLLFNSLLAFFAFSLCASSVYLLNDLLDLDADRHHKTKCNRPFAAGSIPALHGIVLIPLLLMVVAILCFLLPLWFTFALLLYYVATTAYSFGLKQHIMLDVVVLAGLYTMRLLAGAAATGIELSSWLMAFSMFIFLSLAMVKRYTELVGLKAKGVVDAAKGRGYEVEDIALLSALGGASGYISVLVMALYISSDGVQAMYSHPQVLWAVCPVLLYWVSRVWIIAHRGKMHDDPIVFAIKDRVSQVVALLIGSILLLAV